MIIFKRRHGFVNKDGTKFVGYIYEDTKSGRQFSAAHCLGCDTLFINELDESFDPRQNTYSTITTTSLKSAKRKMEELVTPIKKTAVFA